MALVNYMGDSGSSLFSFSGINRGLFGSASQSGRGASTGSGSRVSQGQKYDKPDYEGYPGDASYMNHLDQQFQKAQRKGLSKYGNDLKFYYASPEYKEALRLQQNQVYNEKTAEENKEKGDIFMSTNKAKNTLGQFVLDKNASAGSYELYRGRENQGYISDKQSYVDGIRKSPNYDPETDALYPVYYDQQTSNMLEAGKWADDVYKGVKTHKQSGGGKRQDIQLNDYLETVTTTVDRTWSRMNNFEQIGHALESLWENIPEGARYALSQNFYNDAVNDNQIFDFKMKKATKEDVKNKRASEVGQLIHVVDKRTGGLAFENINPDEEMWSEIMNDPYELKRLQDAHAFKFLQKRKEMYPSTDNTDKTDITTNINAASGASRREDAGGMFFEGWSQGIYTNGKKVPQKFQKLGQNEGHTPGAGIWVSKKDNPKQLEIANMSYAGKTLRDVIATNSLPNVDPKSGKFGEVMDYGKEYVMVGGKWQEANNFSLDNGIIIDTEKVGWGPSLNGEGLIPMVELKVAFDNDDAGSLFNENPDDPEYLHMMNSDGGVSSIGWDTFVFPFTNFDNLSQEAQDRGIASFIDEGLLEAKYGAAAVASRKINWGNDAMIVTFKVPVGDLSILDLNAGEAGLSTTSGLSKHVARGIGGTSDIQNIRSAEFNEKEKKLEAVSNATLNILGQK